MSVEALPAQTAFVPQGAWQEGRPRFGKIAEHARESVDGVKARWLSSEKTQPTSFDLQFDAIRVLHSPDFPQGVSYSFAKPDQPTNKPLVVVECGVNEAPNEIKEFMGLLVENGWPIVSLYHFAQIEGLLPDDYYPSVIKQKVLASKLVVNEVLETEDPDQFHTFGHSMGAQVATLLAATDPQRCLSNNVYAPAGMIEKYGLRELIAITRNRTKQENLQMIRKTLRHPQETIQDSRGAISMKLYATLPWVRKLGIRTHGIFGHDDPLVPEDRRILLSADSENQQFDEIVVLYGTRHSNLVKEPTHFIDTVMRLLSAAEHDARAEEKDTETILFPTVAASLLV